MRIIIVLICLLFIQFNPFSFSQTAKEIIEKADELMRANSSYSEIRMTIQKPDWSRTIGMKAWALEPDYAIIYITEPARDKGTVTLKRYNEVWNWLPSAQKVIKIPPSMMLQSWMGSDFTNDDLVRASSIVKDYTHKLLGEEKIDNYNCYKLELIPKPEAGVVWGKIITWIVKEKFLEVKTDYYDEEGTLIKAFNGSNEKQMGGRNIFAHWEMVPYDKTGNKTILDYDEMKFNIKIDESFFSEQNMKHVR